MKKIIISLVSLFFLSLSPISGQTPAQKLYPDFGKSNSPNSNDWATALTISGNNITSCGQTTQMSAVTTPADAFCPAVVWSIDNKDIAQITEGGKLYPVRNGTVTITATATFTDETSILNSKQITISNQHVSDFSLAVMGSSVPRGQGASEGKGYAQLLAQWLSGNAQNVWTTSNISIGGNTTTDVMNRWDADLLPTCSRYVYYGLSLGNEGVHEKGEPAFISYRDNMQLLIKRSRSLGKIPLVGNNYPRGDFNAADYNYVKQLNLLIHEWDVPSINLLGSIDNGAGQWASTYMADNAHPNTAGHAEMFYVFVPSLFDALAIGKPQPARVDNTSISLEKSDKSKRITWSPENVLHSFTLSFSFKTTSTGTLASFTNKTEDTFYLKINPEGKLVYETPSTVSKLTSPVAVSDGEWHQVSLTHYYAWGRTMLYVDGIRVAGSTTIIEKLIPVRFYLNDFQETLQSVDFRELFLHRSGMSAEEITALHQGKMLKSSLEIYTPLNGGAATKQEALENLAQSLNVLAIEEKENAQTYSIIGFPNDFWRTCNSKGMSVYTVTGNKLFTTNAVSLNSFEKLSPGVFIVKIENKDGNIITQKLIKE